MNIIELLIQDHRQVEVALAERNVDQIVSMLRKHDAIETEILYPEARSAGLGALVDHAEAEHGVVRRLLDQIESGVGETALGPLETNVQEHVGEEEGELFVQLRSKVSEERLIELGEAAQRLKGSA